MNAQPKRKLGWRLLRWALIGLAVLATLAAVLVTEENWRAKRDWEHYKRAAAERGERLEVASIIPAAVPDDQNFFAAPIVAETWRHLEKLALTGQPSDGNDRMRFNIYPGDDEHSPNDFKMTSWQAYFRRFQTNGFPVPATAKSPAEDVLFGLSQFDSALEELRQAVARPAARMPIKYEDGFDNAGQLLQWLAKIKVCGQFLNLRIRAEIEAGQTDNALADIKLFQQFTAAATAQPMLITELVRIAMLSILEDALVNSLQQHRWSDVQLAELQNIIAREDFFVSFRTALETEKVYAINEFEKQRITRQMRATEDHGGTPVTVTNSLRAMPLAYFYRNQLAFAELHQRFIEPLLDHKNRIIQPTRTAEMQKRAKTELGGLWLYTAQAQMVFPAISSSASKLAQVQSKLDMTRVVCALERFRLLEGKYPETLTVLAPKFITALPHDIINGKPLNYRRTDDGKFVLYSVGWNETDDGGKVAITKTGSLDSRSGDWVWPYTKTANAH